MTLNNINNHIVGLECFEFYVDNNMSQKMRANSLVQVDMKQLFNEESENLEFRGSQSSDSELNQGFNLYNTFSVHDRHHEEAIFQEKAFLDLKMSHSTEQTAKKSIKIISANIQELTQKFQQFQKQIQAIEFLQQGIKDQIKLLMNQINAVLKDPVNRQPYYNNELKKQITQLKTQNARLTALILEYKQQIQKQKPFSNNSEYSSIPHQFSSKSDGSQVPSIFKRSSSDQNHLLAVQPSFQKQSSCFSQSKLLGQSLQQRLSHRGNGPRANNHIISNSISYAETIQSPKRNDPQQGSLNVELGDSYEIKIEIKYECSESDSVEYFQNSESFQQKYQQFSHNLKQPNC